MLISLPLRNLLLLFALLLAAPAIASTATAAPAAISGLAPLPKGCGGGLPPGANVPVCCVSGYVILNGQPVDGARVTITNVSDGSEPIRLFTTGDSSSAAPSFRANLSGAPLNVQPGQTIQIVAEFSGKSHSITYVAQAGGQQVDVVIPQQAAGGYIFERKFGTQTEPGTFALYRGDIARDGVGNVYVTDTDNSRIQVFNSSGAYLFSWGSNGVAPGQFGSPTGITIDSQFNVYVTDVGQNTVHKFTTGGVWLATWPLGTPTEDALANDVAVDGAGNLYVTTYVMKQGTTPVPGATQVKKLDKNGVAQGAWGEFGSADGQLKDPIGVWVGLDGQVYVADSGNNRIVVFSTDGTYLRTFGDSIDLNSPRRVTIAPNGEIYVADNNNERVMVFSSAGAYLRKWGEEGTAAGQFLGPGGIAVGGTEVYVVDSDNQRIQVFTTGGTFVRQWGSPGDSDQKLFGPEKATLDGSNNLYVADARRNRVRKYDPGARLLLEFGSTGNGDADRSDDGELDEPIGVALDSGGNIYVADMFNHRIQVFSPGGAYLRQWGTPGSANGQFAYPVGVAIDQSDNVYVVEQDPNLLGNHRLQKFDTLGNWKWTRGGPGAGSGDQQFDQPRAVAVDTSGNIYVADTHNCRIQKLSPAGDFIGRWGQCGAGNPENFWITGVAVDQSNIVHVTYFGNARVERFASAGVSLGTWGKAGPNSDELGELSGIAVGPDGRVYILSRAGQSLQVFRPTNYDKPIATIVAATPQSTNVGQPVTLRGLGASSTIGGPPLSYEWFLNSATTPFATTATATLPTNGLAAGVYTIGFQVKAGAVVSDRQTILIDVRPDSAGRPRSWTFLLYLAADNPDIDLFLNEQTPLGAIFRLRKAHSNAPSNVNIVALYDGPRANDTTRWIFRPNQAPIEEAQPEVNTGDPQTLIDFVRQGKIAAPADAYYLAIANHGNALDGIAWDQTSNPQNLERLTNQELSQALMAITDGGQRPLDILHLDACLMGMLETAYQVRSTASYLIVSENLAWSAFAYEAYRNEVQVSTSPSALATAIARRYGQIVAASQAPYTISVLDMQKLDGAAVSVDQLAESLLNLVAAKPGQWQTLKNLRVDVQKLDSNGDLALTNLDEYVDLDHLAEIVASRIADAQVDTAAQQLRTELDQLVLYQEYRSAPHGGIFVDLDNARGIGIFYPPTAGARIYENYRNELDLAAQTDWDEFLQAELSTLAGPVASAPAPDPVAPLRLRQFVYLPMLAR